MTILMSSNFSRVVLAASLFIGTWGFSSCSQDGSPSMEKVDSVNYARVPLSLSGIDVAVQPLEESSARALSFELDNSNQKLPKVKALTDGTKVLCIIRSSNINQPVNYIKATLVKQNGRTKPTYRLSFDETVTGSPSATPSETTFAYDSRYPLGTLSMMVVAGGEWNETTKKLNINPELVRADNDDTAMEYDMPYVSEWRPLDHAFKNGSSDPSSLSIALKGHDPNVANAPLERYTLKPVGMLLRMPVEEEMAEDGGGRYRLNALTIRSTAFSGQGYFDFSTSNVRGIDTDAITEKRPSYTWRFKSSAETDERVVVKNPTVHTFDDAGSVVYGTRKLKKFKPRYYLYLWTMPRGQQPDAVANGNVRTQIFADVDVVPEDGRPVIYSNSSSADDWELKGRNGELYAVVPRMSALPVYASDRLVPNKTDGSSTAFVQGKSYTLTLNLNRPDLPLELLSQYPVNKDYNGFAKVANEAAYIVNDRATAQLGEINTAFSSLNGTWAVPEFMQVTMLFGALNNYRSSRPVTLESSTAFSKPVDHRITPVLSSEPYADAGTYIANRLKDGSLNPVRMLLAFANEKKADGTVVVYSLIYYPSMNSNGSDKQRRGERLSILRSEYTTNNLGQPVYRFRLRYIGPYSLDLGILDPNMPVQDDNAAKPSVVAALKKILAKGDAYWNDELRKHDDITRDFPLWKKDRTTGAISQAGSADYNLGDMGYLVYHKDKPSTVYFGKSGIGYPADSYGGYSRTSEIPYLPQAPVFMMRARLTHK